MDTRKRVEELCEERGITPGAVAKMAGLNHSTFSASKVRCGQLSVHPPLYGSIVAYWFALFKPMLGLTLTQKCTERWDSIRKN